MYCKIEADNVDDIAIPVVAKEPKVEEPSHGETGDTDPMADVDSEPTTVGVAEDVQLPVFSPRGDKSRAKKRPMGVRLGGDFNGGEAQLGETDMAASSDLDDGDVMVSGVKRSKVVVERSDGGGEGVTSRGSDGGGGVTSRGSGRGGGVKLSHGTYDITVNGDEEEGSGPVFTGDVQVSSGVMCTYKPCTFIISVIVVTFCYGYCCLLLSDVTMVLL